MKNYLKLQAKKSVSLFLAVLMLMSCWVWLAPEAEAANVEVKTQYTVEVHFTISNNDYNSGNLQYRTTGNGWEGNQSANQIAINSFSTEGCNKQGEYTKSFTTSAFPTYIYLETTGGGSGNNQARCDVNWIKINGKQVWTGDAGWNGANKGEIYPNYNTGEKPDLGTSGNWSGTYTWPRPHIYGFTDNTASAAGGKNPAINVEINKIGGADVKKGTTYDISKYTLYDNYGVAASSYIINNGKYCTIDSTTTHVSATDNGSALEGDDAADIYAEGNDKDNVIVKANLQASKPNGNNGTANYYLVRTYTLSDGFGGSQSSKASAAINVKYPVYEVTFDGKGTVNDATFDPAVKDSSGNTLSAAGTGKYVAEGYYGKSFTAPSNEKASAEGYTFYGFWSAPQPTSGSGWFYNKTADFAQPCSNDDFTSYKAMSGAVVSESDKVVTVDSDGDGAVEKYYNAGTKYDANEKTISADKVWYGWWCSKDLSVKFYDVDGKFLGQKVVKYGQTQADIEWPVSAYTTYTSGAFTYNVNRNVWIDNGTGEKVANNNYTFTKDTLILTPEIVLADGGFVDKYDVKFTNPNNGNSVLVGTEGGIYDYRQNITDRANEAKDKIAATPSDVDGDLQFSYELLGWSSVVPTTGKNYHVLLEDADFDVNGTAIGLNSDWVVRNDATYYAVYRRHTKTYVVNFNYKDATGADATRQLKVKYGASLVPPTDYVPYTYVTGGFGYTFDGWTYTNKDGDAKLGYAATIPFTNEYISIQEAALDGNADLEPITLTATYGAPVATPYTVTFNYVDGKGADVSKQATVKNEELILPSTVETLTPAENWDHEDQLYTYADQWEIIEGAGAMGVGGAEKKVGDKLYTSELTGFTPTSNVTFKAVYANPVPFFTVTYIDGANTYSERILQGSNVPAWIIEETNEEYVPADYEGEGGTYEFQGWYDQKQVNTDATNGNKITTADKVAGNLTLYSQFKFVPDTFTVKFMNHDGTVQLGAGEYQKGQNIEALVARATVGAQSRASDETYDYVFLGWDKPVPTFCEGYDVTFIAQYKPVYKYYNVKWYNSRLVNDEWVADKTIGEDENGKEVETNLLATTHHTYNSKLYTPAVDNLTCLEAAPEGQNYVFAGWYYNDAEGNAVKYERGIIVTAEMEFYATYTLTNKVYTVTTVVKGDETRYTVASGATAEIPDPQAGYVDAEKHDAFDGWYTDADCTTAFEADTVITADTKIYAKFTEGDHVFPKENSELKTAPTYYAEGEMTKWCSCDKTKTSKTESIDKLTDEEIRTGTMYLGGKFWSSEGEAANITDNDEISIFVNANTDVIITANDTGDVDALYNPSGIGMGVKYIRAFAFPAKYTLTAENYGAAQQLTLDVYVDESEALTNNANFAVKLGDIIVADLDENGEVQYDEEGNIKYKSLESGEAYIIYYYVTDKAGNQLNRKVRTAKFIYDNDAPAFTVEGESNEAAVPTYCGVATVTGIEKDVVLTVNGEVVEVEYEADATTGTYEIEYAEGIDNVIITATDKSGNKYSKKIKVADHSYLLTEQASTCGAAGYKKEVCIICGDVKTDDVYPALDHVWGQPQVTPADCVNNGYVVVKCENCGEEVITEFEEDGVTPAIPALGHVFAKDDNDEIIYTTVTASTCKTNGLAEAYCTECNGELEGGYLTKELELDDKNHEDVTVTEVEADCVNNGYYTKACSCGVTIEHKDHETDPEIYAAKGHGEKAWEVVKEANCYQPGTMVEKCTVCTAITTAETAYGYTEDADANYTYVTRIENEGEENETEVKVTEEIDGKTYYKYYLVPATGEHVKYVTEKVDSVPGTQGYVKYACKTEGCPWTGKKDLDKVEAFTVTFLKEDGTELAKITKDEGEYIANTDVTAPEKAATKENRYSFAGWVEVIKGEDGKETAGATYKLPLEVTKDMTLKASYKATKILYTHQFVVPTTWTETLADGTSDTTVYATLVGAYGDERVPAGTPVFKHKDANEDARLKKLYTFEFRGWKNAAGVLVTDFTVEDSATFTAYFVAVPVEYEVIFYNGSEVIWTTKVDGGAVVEYANIDNKGTEDEADDVLILPGKAYDAEYHYAFSGKWYTDAACEKEYVVEFNADGSIKSGAITEKTRLYAGFTATAHTYAVNTKVGTVVDEANPEVKDGIIQKADCVLPEITAKICSCGDEIEVETKAALGHDAYKKNADGSYVLVDGEKVENGETVTDKDGVAYYVVKCSVCGEELSRNKVSVTVKFENYNGLSLGTKNYQLGEDIVAPTTTPVKPDDNASTYTFAGWFVKGDDTQTIVTVLGKATADITFVAKFTATDKMFKVSYLSYKGDVALYTVEVKYGATLPAYVGKTDEITIIGTDYKDNYTEDGHYVFSGEWDKDATYVVKGDTTVRPVLELEDHNKQTAYTDPTCTTAGGQSITCTGCAYHASVNATQPALGHAWGNGVVTTPPIYETQTPGVMTYTCSRCGVTKTEEIPGDSYTVKATVKDENGNPSANVRVELLRKQADGAYTYLTHKETDANGVVIFSGLEPGDYRVYVTSTKTHYDTTVNEDGSVAGGDITAQPENNPVDESCKCSCHKDNFWGILYRLIQKIIKFFAGKPSCCACPDSRI